MPVPKARPQADELAAIVAAYLVRARRDDTPATAAPSRWRLAGRLTADDVRYAAGTTPRWSVAGRLDG